MNSAPAISQPVRSDVELNDTEFKRIATIIHAEAGIRISENKRALTHSRLARRINELNLSSFNQYCDLIESKNGEQELLNMIAALTTNVTSFFREPHHFEYLKNTLLPPLIEKANAGGRVRIWSAGCSNGQETYSIAMTLLGVDPDAGRKNIKILGTDIDPVVIHQAKSGIYPDVAVENVPADLKAKYLKKEIVDGEAQWTVGQEPRQLIKYNRLNLMSEWPFQGPFDAIFCRNVVIYFDEATREKVWTKYINILAPEGALFIGHSERLTGPIQAHFRNDGVTTYRLKSKT